MSKRGEMRQRWRLIEDKVKTYGSVHRGYEGHFPLLMAAMNRPGVQTNWTSFLSLFSLQLWESLLRFLTEGTAISPVFLSQTYTLRLVVRCLHRNFWCLLLIQHPAHWSLSNSALEAEIRINKRRSDSGWFYGHVSPDVTSGPYVTSGNTWSEHGPTDHLQPHPLGQYFSMCSIKFPLEQITHLWPRNHTDTQQCYLPTTADIWKIYGTVAETNIDFRIRNFVNRINWLCNEAEQQRDQMS